MAYEIIQIDNSTWRIEDNQHVRFFLLKGQEKALLIDSGMQVNNAREIAKELTDLPVELINTHADRDHIGSNYEFDWFYMHPAEASNYYNTQKADGKFKPVYEGDIIDIGNRPLEIISLAGHTPGSIAILDINNRVLFSGDPIQDGLIFMFGVQREIHAYMNSLKHLELYKEKFDKIYPSHGSLPVKQDLIGQLYKAAEKILLNEYESTEAEFHGVQVKKIDFEIASFLVDMK